MKTTPALAFLILCACGLPPATSAPHECNPTPPGPTAPGLPPSDPSAPPIEPPASEPPPHGASCGAGAVVSPELIAGGLTALPAAQKPGPNLVSNGDFEAAGGW